MSDIEVRALFREHNELRRLRPNTIEVYDNTLRRFSGWLGPIDLVDASKDDIERFLATHTIEERTLAHYVSRFRAFYRWARAEGHCPANPTDRIVAPKLRPGVPRPIGDADLDVALRFADGRLRAFLCLAAFAGLRCQEIAGIHRSDVLEDQEPQLLIVREGKGGKQRILPMHPEIASALHNYALPRTGYVFPRWGDPSVHIRSYTVSHVVNEHLHGLGIDATAHRLRHWFATRTYQSSRDLRMVQELLGHSSPDTTAIYAQYAPGSAVQAVAELNPRPAPMVGALTFTNQ